MGGEGGGAPRGFCTVIINLAVRGGRWKEGVSGEIGIHVGSTLWFIRRHSPDF